MKHREIKILHQNGYDLFITDLSSGNEEEVCNTFIKVGELCLKSDVPYGIIHQSNKLMATPKMRQTASRISKELQETNMLIGIAIHGYNTFLTLVAKLAFSEVKFGNNEKDCIQILDTLFEKNHKKN